MADLTEPEDIMYEHLRSEVTELVTVGGAAKHTNGSQNFNGDASTTVFTITQGNLLNINSVTISSVTQAKYANYQINLIDKKITFTTAPATGTNNITVDYDYNSGSNPVSWIYADMPRDDLSSTSYPRIGVVKLSEPAIPLGLGGTQYWHDILFQIDCLAYKHKTVSISSEIYEGAELVRYMGRQVVNNILKFDLNKLGNKLFDPHLIDNHSIPFDESRNIFRQTVEITMKAQSIAQ